MVGTELSLLLKLGSFPKILRILRAISDTDDHKETKARPTNNICKDLGSFFDIDIDDNGDGKE